MRPEGVEARSFPGVNGLEVYALCAGQPDAKGGLILLLHGFPELSFSWRNLLQPLAESGYYVVAPDLRGYGRTSGWSTGYDIDLDEFGMPNLVRDTVALVDALGFNAVSCVVGHDFGSPLAAYCTLTRPDLFRSLVLMSAPFAGPPRRPVAAARFAELDRDLATLTPPRRHYQSYYSTREANREMLEGDLGRMLRGYYHGKSADWTGNAPRPLEDGSAAEMARLPFYYVMRADENMAETSERYYADFVERGSRASWLSPDELDVYAETYRHTSFQGGLNWYRCVTGGVGEDEWISLGRRTIDVPSLFIAGASDWGIYQTPGAFEVMQKRALTDLKGTVLIAGAGHWVQQERPDETLAALRRFLLAPH